MAALVVFVDYDNVDPKFTSAGPVQVARILLATVPLPVLGGYDTVIVRLYGGWRSNNTRTSAAQRLLAEILRDSPTVYQLPAPPKAQPIRLLVELADRPIGWQVALEHTLVKNRGLRSFRANPDLLRDCVDVRTCGLQRFFSLSPATVCDNAACGEQLGRLLARDEQKMVDTLLVTDVAAAVFMQQARDVVIVSSDTDIWPGILLSLRGGSNVFHVHPKPSMRTPSHLLRTIGSRLSATYTELRL